MILGRIKFSTS